MESECTSSPDFLSHTLNQIIMTGLKLPVVLPVDFPEALPSNFMSVVLIDSMRAGLENENQKSGRPDVDIHQIMHIQDFRVSCTDDPFSIPAFAGLEASVPIADHFVHGKQVLVKCGLRVVRLDARRSMRAYLHV